jgi:hypothetical protein
MEDTARFIERWPATRSPTVLLVALLGSACHADSTSQPDDPAIFERIGATPGKFSAQYPWHWTTPNDGVIVVDARTASTTRVVGVLTRLDLDVTLRYVDDPALQITCTTQFPGTPETRFGCVGEGEVHGTFRLAQGRGCPASQAFNLDLWFSPACWDGEFTTPSGAITVHHDFEQRVRREIPVPRFTWIGPDDRPILDIDNASYTPTLDLRAPPSTAAPPPALKKQLVLLSLALGYYYVLWRY